MLGPIEVGIIVFLGIVVLGGLLRGRDRGR